MNPLQVFSLILAILLFLPGACFAFFGVVFLSDIREAADSWPFLLIGFLILISVFFLGRFAFRKDVR